MCAFVFFASQPSWSLIAKYRNDIQYRLRKYYGIYEDRMPGSSGLLRITKNTRNAVRTCGGSDSSRSRIHRGEPARKLTTWFIWDREAFRSCFSDVESEKREWEGRGGGGEGGEQDQSSSTKGICFRGHRSGCRINGLTENSKSATAEVEDSRISKSRAEISFSLLVEKNADSLSLFLFSLLRVSLATRSRCVLAIRLLPLHN